MKSSTERGTLWTRWVPLVGALALVGLGTGCESTECYNSFDCQDTPERRDPQNPYVCQDNQCVPLRDIRPPPPPDAGTDGGTGTEPDGGTGMPGDGGTDGGVNPCQDVPHDETFGTLELAEGFGAPESAPLPADILAVTAVGPGPTYTLYGVSSADQNVYALGTWPSLARGATGLFEVRAPEDRTANVYLGSYLVNEGQRLLTGYTKAGSGFPGYVGLHDIENPGTTSYYVAPGNFSAAAIQDFIFINSLGLDARQGAGIYFLKTDSFPASTGQLATFDPAWKASSGFSAVTTQGVAVFGYYDGGDFINRLRVVSPSLYEPVLGGGAPFNLADAPVLDPGSEVFNLSTFDTGVVMLRGNYDETFTPVYLDVSRVALTLGTGDPQPVTQGDRLTVLKFTDTCTQVELLTPLGPDLLVGLSDKNGRRLVRIQLP